MKNRNSNFPIVPIVLGVAVLIVVIALIGALSGGNEENPEILEGVAYLESLEQKNPADVQQVRRDLYQQKLDAQRDQLLRRLTSGEIDPFTMFQDFVVMGDSRAVGFWYRDFLDKSRVLADGGHTIRNIEAQMDKLVALNPETIYLCYGLNDISIGYWDTAEEYTSEYMSIVKEIQRRLPDATIVVSSILPARDPAFNRSAKWRNIPQWSAALGQACKENGIIFANCDKLAEDYPKLWDPDGIHFREAFYPYWASNLIVAKLMEGAADES